MGGACETPLAGGRITPGVVRVGATVRRPLGPHSSFVHDVLRHLEAAAFDGAPRFLGIDEDGREVLTYIEGAVPLDLDSRLSDDQFGAAAELLRRFHDATAGSGVACRQEVVCHNDFAPPNAVFVDELPVALIDFDYAAPGARVADFAYSAFAWLNLGTDGPNAAEQVRRLRLFCDAYELGDRKSLVAAIESRVCEVLERHVREHKLRAAVWWKHQLLWLAEHRRELETVAG